VQVVSEVSAVFEDNEPQVETVEAEVEATPEVEAALEVEAETKEVEPTSTEEENYDNMPHWVKKTVKDERGKRQASDARIAELEGQISKQDVEPVKTPDVFEDQEAFADHLRNENQSQITQLRAEIARDMMMEAHDDYEEMEAAFIEEAKNNPVLYSQAQQAKNPAKFAYEQAKKIQDFNSMQDVGSYKEKLRAEIRAEIEAETNGKREAHNEKASNLSPNLANMSGSSVNEKSLDSIESMFGSNDD
jgi:hypothetical protein